MSKFDADKFIRAKFELRTKKLEFSPFASMDFDKELTVRALTGVEFAKCLDAKNDQEKREEVAQALMSSQSEEKMDALRKMMGLTNDTTGDLSRRVESLMIGIVSPDIPETKRRDVVLKILEYFVTDFYLVTNEIWNMTGEGGLLKQRHSGKSPQSEPA